MPEEHIGADRLLAVLANLSWRHLRTDLALSKVAVHWRWRSDHFLVLPTRCCRDYFVTANHNSNCFFRYRISKGVG